jgi:hypothetical protein
MTGFLHCVDEPKTALRDFNIRNIMESFECSQLLGGFSRIVIDNGVHSFFKSIAFLKPVESVGIDFQGGAHASEPRAIQGDVGVQTQSGFCQPNGDSL